MRVLVTRPIDQAENTAEKLRGLGFKPLVCPLTRFTALSNWELRGRDLTGIILTSANAVKAIEASEKLDALGSATIACVGEKTAEAARKAGFRSIAHISPDVESLIKALDLNRFAPQSERWLYLRGEDVTRDLGTEFPQAVTDIVIYDMRADSEEIAKANAALSEARVDGALFYSLRAVDLLGRETQPVIEVPAFCLSSAIAARAKEAGFKESFSSTRATEAALFEHLQEWWTARRLSD